MYGPPLDCKRKPSSEGKVRANVSGLLIGENLPGHDEYPRVPSLIALRSLQRIGFFDRLPARRCERSFIPLFAKQTEAGQDSIAFNKHRTIDPECLEKSRPKGGTKRPRTSPVPMETHSWLHKQSDWQ